MPTVVFQGAMGAFSELAARIFFENNDINLLPCEKYKEMFEIADSQKADYVVVPIENSTGGSVYEKYNIKAQQDYDTAGVIGQIKKSNLMEM